MERKGSRTALMMIKGPLAQKPRSVSDGAEKKPPQRPDPDQPQSRERSFSDVFGVFSKKPKVAMKDASTNTTPLDELYTPLPPTLPPKRNVYHLNPALNTVEIEYEELYLDGCLEIRRMNVETELWTKTVEEEEPVYQEVITEGLKVETDTDLDSDSERTENGPPKTTTTTTTTTHKRDTSGWSLGSFHIGTPFELTDEVLVGPQWEPFLSDKTKSDTRDSGTQWETPEDAVDGKSTEKRSKPEDSNINDILKSVRIIEEKAETPKDAMQVQISLVESDQRHTLPPKLTQPYGPGIDRRFRSSVFYNLHNNKPAGPEPLPEIPKSRTMIKKIKTKLRRSSID